MTLNAREIFKLEEEKYGKSYHSGEQRVVKYGKIDKNTAYRIIERTKWIYSNHVYTLEIVSINEEIEPQLKGFDTMKEVSSYLENTFKKKEKVVSL